MAELQTITAAKSGMHADPDARSEMLNELLFGENFQIIEPHGQWYKARALHDGYEGYVRAEDAQSLAKTSTHRVRAPLAHIYAKPDFKTPPVRTLYFLSALNIKRTEENGFLQIETDQWISREHVMPIDHRLRDYTETALNFLGSPYVWGGRSYAGLDCSALVQLSLMAAGISAPRDTKDQVKSVGKPLGAQGLRRGDFVFFERHVGIMIDADYVLNATARTMRVVAESLDDLSRAYGGLLQARRIS
jgi:hypothetical protein